MDNNEVQTVKEYSTCLVPGTSTVPALRCLFFTLASGFLASFCILLRLLLLFLLLGLQPMNAS